MTYDVKATGFRGGSRRGTSKGTTGEPRFTPALGEDVNDVLGPLMLDAIGESTLCVPATVAP